MQVSQTLYNVGEINMISRWQLYIALHHAVYWFGYSTRKSCKQTGRVWRYQRDNQNLYIEEEQKIQSTKEKVQIDKKRSTKHTYKTKDRVTWTPLKPGINSGAPEG